MSITITGVQYLYPRLNYESWSNKTGYENLEKKTNFLIEDNLDSNLSFLWSLTCLLASCLATYAGRAHSLDVVISLADLAICLAYSIGGLGLP